MRDVHVAGWGAVTGFGRGVASLIDGVFAGHSALLPRRRTAGGPVPTDVAAEIDGLAAIEDEERALAVAVDAAREALDDAHSHARDTVLVVATTKGDLSGIEGGGGVGFGLVGPFGARLAERIGARSLGCVVSCACASGLVALSLAARKIRAGACERALVVGVDVLEPFVLAGFGGLGALDRGPCRPFDRTRAGLSLGDGAAAIVLSARASESRGVRITGFGGANDACHVTGPDREGLGVALATERAFALARIDPRGVDLVHLHGTGTIANDRTEALGLVRAFGGATPPAFGTKGQTGHTLGAAGVVETIVLAESLRRGEAPANHALVEPDVDPALSLVRERSPLACARHGLKVSSGFGGIAAALVLST